MATAKFIVVGETGMWARVRIQEEIHAHGLEGSVVDAGNERLGIFVSGDRLRIQKLYNDLVESLPREIQPTNLMYGDFTRPQDPAAAKTDTETVHTIIELLKEIEKNTRKINQKLDRLAEGRQTRIYEAEESTESTTQWGWNSNEKKNDKGGGGETATNAFANMFG